MTNRRQGLAATLHDAVALAEAFGPGARIGLGAAVADSDILAPQSLNLTTAEAAVAARTGRPGYFLAFADAGMAPVIETLCHATGTGFMAACLAAPWAGRTVYQGHLFEGGRQPVDLARAFSIALEGGTGVVAHRVVTAGAAAIRRACTGLKEQGRALALIDAIDERDCAEITEALQAMALTGGSAWLARQPHTAAASAPAGPVAILSGALDRQTVFQLGAARLAMPVFDLDLSAAAPERRALQWATAKIGEPFIVSSSMPPDRQTPGAAAAAILGRVAHGLAAAGVTRFIVTGDETAQAVLAALGVTTLTAGVGFGELRWLQADTMAICIKPPGAGTKDLFLREFEPQIRLNESAE